MTRNQPWHKWFFIDLTERKRTFSLMFVFNLFALARSNFLVEPAKAQSVDRLPDLTLWGSSTIDPGLKSHEYMFVTMWVRMARLPRGQVSHQRWMWGFHYTQAMKHASERIHHCFEAQGVWQQGVYTPQTRDPPHPPPPEDQRHTPSPIRGGDWSGRYASYWYAFVLFFFLFF